MSCSKLWYFSLALFVRFIDSLMRIQYPKPRYDPMAYPFSIIVSLLLKELSVHFYNTFIPILAENEDPHNNVDEFDFRPDTTPN